MTRFKTPYGVQDFLTIPTRWDSGQESRAKRASNSIIAELTASNRELENYASSVAHDLQAPLAKIRAYAESLMQEAANEKSHEYLTSIVQSSERMTRLIRLLLTEWRVNKGGGSLEKVDLEEVMGDVLSDLKIAIQESGAVVDVIRLPSMTARRSHMHQLFQNLIENSIKYRKKTVPPRILVNGESTRHAVEVVVKDNGMGFDQKHAEDIFKPFVRLHEQADCKGDGMGLALCRKILSAQGGRVIARSRVGEGTTFVLTWPHPELPL
jgi:light-regulated signal transduction histidine kinase (bacteriophytochrome)